MNVALLSGGIEVIAISAETLWNAQRRLLSCEQCNPVASRTPLKALLDRAGERQNSRVEYLIGEPAICPNCQGLIAETTLVAFDSRPLPDAKPRYFEPSLEENNLVFIDAGTLSEAEELISGCEHCSASAEMSLDYILDALTGNDPTSTEYVLCRPGRCPQCRRDITEKTLIVPKYR